MAPSYDANTKGSDLVRALAANIRGKIVLVTGSSPGGIGARFAISVATHAQPGMLILTGRTASTIQATQDAIATANPTVKTKPLILDLASLQSVRAAAQDLLQDAEVPHIDVLVNNAGVLGLPYGTTVDGFERHFGTNHVGHFLFTNLLMPKILQAPGPRVVCVSSSLHRLNPIRWTDYHFGHGETYDHWRAYGQSKTANMLMAVALARRLEHKGLQAFSLHPGVYITNLMRNLDQEWARDMASLQQAERAFGTICTHITPGDFSDEEALYATHVLCSFSDDLQGLNGRYFLDCHVADQYKEEIYPWAKDPIDAERLWTLSEKLVGQEFMY